jgi:hypothetical protein
VLALLLVTGPAHAGGPFQPPDGVGNPNGADYTGYQVVGYVYGVRHSAALNVKTRISCVNTGGVEADDVVAQFYSNGDVPDRPPVQIDESGNLPLSDQDDLETGVGTGTAQDFMIARILARDSVKKKNPAIVCQANVETTAGASVSQLTVQTLGKKKKK